MGSPDPPAVLGTCWVVHQRVESGAWVEQAYATEAQARAVLADCETARLFRRETTMTPIGHTRAPWA